MNFDFSVIGLTANIAQMVEKMGEGLKVHVSGASKRLLDSIGGYRCEYRGILDMGVSEIALVMTF